MLNQNFARELYKFMQNETDELFSGDTWSSRVLRYAAEHREFMNALLLFIDVFPVLSNDDHLSRHLQMYFNKMDLPEDFPGDT